MIEVGYKYRFFGEDAKVYLSWITLSLFTYVLALLRRPPRNSELLHTLIATLSWHRYLLTGVISILESDDFGIL